MACMQMQKRTLERDIHTGSADMHCQWWGSCRPVGPSSLALHISRTPPPSSSLNIPFSPPPSQQNSMEKKTKPITMKQSAIVDDTILERGRRIKLAAEIGLAESSRGRHWSRALRRRIMKGCCKDEMALDSRGAEEEEEVVVTGEVVEIERRVRTLQRLVPGGEALGMETLFEETADYIEALEEQVAAMRALAAFLDGLEKERRMMGG